MQSATVLSLASPAPVEQPVSLLERYNSYFHNQLADTPDLLRTALAIRYQVYCLERKFENADEHDDQLERDEFDAGAIHSLVIHRPTSEAIGTARLILPQHAQDGLPIERRVSVRGSALAETPATVMSFAMKIMSSGIIVLCIQNTWSLS